MKFFFNLRLLIFSNIFLKLIVQNEECCTEVVECTAGADLGFSRGGGADFSKSFRKFCRPFFCRSTNLIFPARGFSARAPHSKLVYISAKGAFRKIKGSLGQKWIS